MTNSSTLKTESYLEEKILSEEEAKAQFGEALVDEVQAEFKEDAVQALAQVEAPSEAHLLSEEEAQAQFGEALVDEVQAEFKEDAVQALAQVEAPSEAHVLSEEEAQAQFGEALVDEVQTEFKEDAEQAFVEEKAETATPEEGVALEDVADADPEKRVAENETQEIALTSQAEKTPKPDYLLSDEGMQALLSVFWDGFQRPEGERAEFLKEALSQEEFSFFPLLAEPMKLSLLSSELEEKTGTLENAFSQAGETNLSFGYVKGLVQVSLQMSTLRELRRNSVGLLFCCVVIFAALALFGAIIFNAPHLSQGKATVLSALLMVPAVTVVLAIISLGRVWEYFTFIQGSGDSTKGPIHSILSDGGGFLSNGIEGVEEKLTENKTSLLRVSGALEQTVQRLILAGSLMIFSVVIWISLSIASTFQKFVSWEHVGFFVFTSFVLFLVTFFVRIGQWKTPSAGRTWGWCFALAVFVFTLFGAGAIGRGPIRIDPNEMPEISSSWLHNFSPNGFFEGLRGWFYPGVALQWVPPKS